MLDKKMSIIYFFCEQNCPSSEMLATAVGICLGYQPTVWACYCSLTKEQMQGHKDVFQVHKWEINSQFSNFGTPTEL